MKKKFFLGLLAAALVFGAGAFLGRVSKRDLVNFSTRGGASSRGVFVPTRARGAPGASRPVAGPTPTNIVVVNDGESIQAAVKSAPKGTIVRVMPGTYHETVYVDKDSHRRSSSAKRKASGRR